MNPYAARASRNRSGAELCSGARQSFTLIELLIVVTIIAILASLLLPVLNRTKLLAQSAQCTTNLRQLQLAWLTYADDHHGALVPNYERATPPDSNTIRSTSESWVVGSALQSPKTEGICQEALWSYTRKEAVYRCPADRSLWDYPGEPVPLPRPFNVALSCFMNGGINQTRGKAWDPLVIVKSAELLRRPATLFTFIDHDAESMTSGAFFVKRDQTNCWWMIPGARDRGGGANVAFADGHVDFHKWNYPSRRCTGWPTPVTNDLDRADLAWVLSKVPSERDK